MTMSGRTSLQQRVGKRLFIALLTTALLGAKSRMRAAEVYAEEYDIKATHLFHFAQFVNWPPRAFSDSSAPFVIGVLGSNPFGSALDSVIAGEKIKGRRMAVKRARRVDELLDCQIVFVCRSEDTRVAAILSELSSRSILTVSDVPGFCRQGGMIEFMIKKGEVQFEIKSSVTKASGLTVSSQLLKLSK